MSKTIARLGGIDATNANVIAVMDAVMPVVIVIGVLSVPSAVVWQEGLMRPPDTGVRTSNDDSLSSESQVPHIRGMRVLDALLDRRRRSLYARPQRR